MLAGGKKEMAEHGAERDGAKRQSEQQSELSPGSGDLIDIGKRWVGFSPGKPNPPHRFPTTLFNCNCCALDCRWGKIARRWDVGVRNCSPDTVQYITKYSICPIRFYGQGTYQIVGSH